MKQKQSPKPIKYFNEHGINITARIENGKTLFYEYRSDAQKEAEKNRTYIFEIFNEKNQLCGFGVPK